MRSADPYRTLTLTWILPSILSCHSIQLSCGSLYSFWTVCGFAGTQQRRRRRRRRGPSLGRRSGCAHGLRGLLGKPAGHPAHADRRHAGGTRARKPLFPTRKAIRRRHPRSLPIVVFTLPSAGASHSPCLLASLSLGCGCMICVRPLSNMVTRRRSAAEKFRI